MQPSLGVIRSCEATDSDKQMIKHFYVMSCNWLITTYDDGRASVYSHAPYGS